MVENKEDITFRWKDATIIAIVTTEAHCTGQIRFHKASLRQS